MSNTDTDDQQPTPGPWSYSKQTGETGEAFLAQVWGADGDSLAVLQPHHPHIDEATANARLIAAAGTAVSELPEEYDSVEAVRALPELVDATDDALSALLSIIVEIENGLRPLLKSLHGSTDEDEAIREALNGLSEDSDKFRALLRAYHKSMDTLTALEEQTPNHDTS